MSASAIITAIGSTIAALTPSPATPVYEQSNYRKKLEEEGHGNLERMFYVGYEGGIWDTMTTGSWNGTKVRVLGRFFIDIGYQKKGLQGGGGTNLDGRCATDLEQIAGAIYKKANFHTSQIGPLRGVEFRIEQDTDRARIWRISFEGDYELTIS